MAVAPGRAGRLWALLHQRCPRCREGRIFRGVLRMNWYCPVCELRILREPGYGLVAVELSYGLSFPILVALTVGIYFVTRWELHWVLLAAVAAYLPLTPAIFRYARTLWVHWDQAIDPQRETPDPDREPDPDVAEELEAFEPEAWRLPRER